MDHRSFLDQLLFSIGFAIGQNRDLLRRILKEHVADDSRHRLAEKVLQDIELSGYEIDEQQQVIRKRAGGRGW